MARQEAYSRVYRWLNRRLVDVGATANERAVLCAYLEWQEPGKPIGVRTFRGRERFTTTKDVAEVLGVSENVVNKALSGLCKKGVITCVSKGHRGKAARYALAESMPDMAGNNAPESLPDTASFVEKSESLPKVAGIRPESLPDMADKTPKKPAIGGRRLNNKNEEGSDALQARRVAPVPEGTKEATEEPGPLATETLQEAWAAFVAGRDLTPEQEATHARYARSRTWAAIRTGGAIRATEREE